MNMSLRKQFSASLENLLPLSQSINSSLQNDGFPDKKNPSAAGRRGYINGSHSEIFVNATRATKHGQGNPCGFDC